VTLPGPKVTDRIGIEISAGVNGILWVIDIDVGVRAGIEVGRGPLRR